MQDRKNPANAGRRKVLQLAALGTGALLTARLGGLYAETPKVDPESPQAQGLHYVHNASEASDHAQYQKGSVCSNCQLWQGGDAEWGGCGIFPGKNVAANGWCSAWVAQN